MEEKIYKGPGFNSEYKQYMELINYVFKPNRDNDFDFLTLLPKLYKEKYSPAEKNMVVRANGELKAAVGLFYNVFTVAGEKLLVGGVGNVAVHQSARSKGYMVDCMNLCIEDMKMKHADFSFLGGQRQRYGYFSYEPAGAVYDFHMNTKNIYHSFGKDAESTFEIRPLKAEDGEYLDAILKLYTSGRLFADRPRDMLFDILCSWSNTPHVITENGEFRGYFIANGDFSGISEFKMLSAEDMKNALIAIFDFSERYDITFSVPAFDTDAIDFFSAYAEGCGLHHSESYTVFNFRNVTQAFLRLKALSTPLCDCDFSLFIHGIAGDEKIRITVKDNGVSVKNTDGKCDMELGHHEAMRLLFSLNSPKRAKLPAAACANLPLELFVYSADSV
ncbi:MAG: GNAT family N-acetyltransferase [Clostridiales bacterium]|nr:GNAT family N-acetyltransferase [Clostridiales bacterium]